METFYITNIGGMDVQRYMTIEILHPLTSKHIDDAEGGILDCPVKLFIAMSYLMDAKWA